jgi:hypothetical protein
MKTEKEEVYFPPPPPPGFDPVNKAADRKRLADFGLPPEPDALQEPELRKLWATLLSPAMNFSSAKPPSDPPQSFRSSRTRIVALRRTGARQASRLSVSGNWSGGWIAANRGARFRAVAARWRVPTVAIGAAEDANGEPYRCSIWVGLDGKHAWAHSMPQLGTEHTAGPAGGHRFWWQWWVLNSTDLQHYLGVMPIEPGDDVICYLAMLSTTRVVFCFANVTKLRLAVVVVSKFASPMRGSTAEWILERPANGEIVDGEVVTGKLFPMPDFGAVNSADFAASCVHLDDPAIRHARGLQHCRMIQNGTVRADPVRIGITARAERHGKRDLEIRYQPAK